MSGGATDAQPPAKAPSEHEPLIGHGSITDANPGLTTKQSGEPGVAF